MAPSCGKLTRARPATLSSCSGSGYFELLIGAQEFEPATNAFLASGGRVIYLRVVLEAGALAELLAVTVVAERQNGMVPGAVDVGADANSVSALRVSAMREVDVVHVRSVGACDDALRVRGRLVTWLLHLELLVQAQVREVRVDAHVVGSCGLISCGDGSMSG
jgi:hypothetical protein